jgi:Glycosyl transferases group 1
VSAGIEVSFFEQPRDIRALVRRQDAVTYVGGLFRPGSGVVARPSEPRVLPRSTVLPGHRGGAALRAETALLRRDLARAGIGRDDVVVATTPWYWPAVARSGAGRKVADLADDWTALIPGRRQLLRTMHDRIAAQADVVIVAAPALEDLFPGRQVVVVPNATDDDAVTGAPSAKPGSRTIVAVGTLSERFDDQLVGAMLDRLPDWRLELYGEYRYAGASGRPSEGLQRLLARPRRQVTWNGVVPRARLAETLDRGDVLLIAHKGQQSQGQDSMKLYDYAARGRPVVATSGSLPRPEGRPPHVLVSDTGPGLAAAVLATESEPREAPQDRVDWAAANVWSRRWPAWWDAVVGSGDAASS